MKVTLQLFGPFRPFGEQLELTLPEGAAVQDLRPPLMERLPQMESVIRSSRFATETEVLPENAPLADGALLAIIPPVSGG